MNEKMPHDLMLYPPKHNVMKRLILLISSFILFQTISSAQIDTISKLQEEDLNDEYFVYLFNNQIITGNAVTYKNPIFKSSYILVDETEYKSGTVKFYQNEQDFFANTLGITSRNHFVPRIQQGRVNLYEYNETEHNPGFYNANTGMMTGGGSRQKIVYYYNSGFGDLKKATYSNLNVDLQDNPEAMLYLDKYKKTNNLSRGLYVGAGALMLIGTISIYNKFSNTPQGTDLPSVSRELVLVGAGGVLGWVGYFVSIDKFSHLKTAVYSYNQNRF